MPLIIMADVIAYVQYGRCYATRVFGLRLMLLPLVNMADVIAHLSMADGIAMWQMLGH